MTNANYVKCIHNTQLCEQGVFIVTVIKTSRPRQNVCHFEDDGFKCIFMNGNIWISIKISLKFVPKGSVNNIPVLFQIMVWCRVGDNPPSEPMLTRFTDTYIRHWGEMSWMLMYKCTVKTKVWKVVIIPKNGHKLSSMGIWNHNCDKRNHNCHKYIRWNYIHNGSFIWQRTADILIAKLSGL